DRVCIYFKDSGIGIPQGELANVFNPFVQASNNQRPSSGLGLFVSKQLVELHKGQISVRVQNSTEFVIELLKGSAHVDGLKTTGVSELIAQRKQHPIENITKDFE